MCDKEIDSFILKFHQLRRAGYKAHLDLDTNAGKVWIGLKVMLLPVQQKKADKHRSPSYFRRQEKRKAASKLQNEGTERVHEKNESAERVHEKNEGTEKVHEMVGDNKESGEVISNEKDAEKATDHADKASSLTFTSLKKADYDASKIAVVDEDLEDADKAVSYNCETCDFVTDNETTLERHVLRRHNNDADKVERYKCELCDFESKKELTLERHMSQKHQNIEQQDDSDSQESSEEWQQYHHRDRNWRPPKGSDMYRILVAENLKLMAQEIKNNQNLYTASKIEELKNKFRDKPDMFITWQELVERDE